MRLPIAGKREPILSTAFSSLDEEPLKISILGVKGRCESQAPSLSSTNCPFCSQKVAGGTGAGRIVPAEVAAVSIFTLKGCEDFSNADAASSTSIYPAIVAKRIPERPQQAPVHTVQVQFGMN